MKKKVRGSRSQLKASFLPHPLLHSRFLVLVIVKTRGIDGDWLTIVTVGGSRIGNSR